MFGRRTGLRVSELALGAANFGNRQMPGADMAASREIVDAYIAAGGNFIDTSDFYQLGEAEEYLGDLIGGRRDDLVIASKYTYGSHDLTSLTATGNSRKTMMRSVEGSLKRLKTDRIDVYWVHMADGVTPMDEILRGLDDLVRQGKILYIGLSNFPAWRVARGALMADMHGWAPLAAVQVEYSLVERSPDRELLHMCESLGLAAALFSPLGGGLLTGKYRVKEGEKADSVRSVVRKERTPQDTAILDALFAVADETGATPTAVAIAWMRGKANASTTALIPLLGPRTREQLDAQLAALHLDLNPDQMKRLDKASAVPLGVPRQMSEHPMNVDKLFGSEGARVHMPRIPAA